MAKPPNERLPLPPPAAPPPPAARRPQPSPQPQAPRNQPERYPSWNDENPIRRTAYAAGGIVVPGAKVNTSGRKGRC